MKKFHVIGEYGIIRNRSDYIGEQIKESLGQVFLPNNAFLSLMHFIAENNDPNLGIDQAFSVHLKNSKYFISIFRNKFKVSC